MLNNQEIIASVPHALSSISDVRDKYPNSTRIHPRFRWRSSSVQAPHRTGKKAWPGHHSEVKENLPVNGTQTSSGRDVSSRSPDSWLRPYTQAYHAIVARASMRFILKHNDGQYLLLSTEMRVPSDGVSYSMLASAKVRQGWLQNIMP